MPEQITEVQYEVRVIKDATGEVVKTLGPSSYRMCERMQRGVEINLNHNEYSTEIRMVRK